MKTSLLVYIFAALISISFVVADTESAVLDLDATTFEQALKDNELMLVEFYAPWCGHCKRLEPEYEKAAAELKESSGSGSGSAGVTAVLAKVNADNEINKALATTYGIRGFPTLKLFRKGHSQPQDYDGERSAAGLVSFMKRQSKPAITSLSSLAEAQTFSAEDKVVIIGFFDNKDSQDYATFKQVAESLRNDYSFGEVVGNSDAVNVFGVSAPNVILFKKFDEGKNILGSNFNELSDFIKTHSFPLIDEIGPENYKNYADSGLPLGYLFINPSVEGQKDSYIERIRSLAQTTKGKLNWVWIDFSKYAKHGEKLGLSGSVVPSLAIENMQSGAHYAFDESAEITTSSVEAWVNKFLAGQLEPTIKSEPIPEDNSGPVKIIVAKNYDQIVLDSTKDVFVEFYAPWCGHCKKLAPIFEELGAAFKDIPSVVIAKVDATANDVDPKLGIRGFPTLKFFPANNKGVGIDYNGDRSLADMTNFIKENASVKFELAATKDEL